MCAPKKVIFFTYTLTLFRMDEGEGGWQKGSLPVFPKRKN